MTTWLEPDGGIGVRMGDQLKARLGTGRIIRAPGAHDAMAGLIARDAGFDALYVSGAAVTASRGLPDLGVLTMEELTSTVRSIAPCSRPASPAAMSAERTDAAKRTFSAPDTATTASSASTRGCGSGASNAGASTT